MKTCPHCGSEDNTGVTFLCGTQHVGMETLQSRECRIRSASRAPLSPEAAGQAPQKPSCAFCGACAVTVAASFADFECGTSWTELEGFERSQKCAENQNED